MSRVLPILFNTEMVRAILDGRKTVTRRAVRYKYSNTEMKMHTDKYGTRLIEIQMDIEGETWGKNSDGSTWHKLLPYIEKNPPCKKGDILYVRETWYYESFCEDREDSLPDLPSGNRSYRYVYKADNPDYPVIPWTWRPSIHMPKEAARIWLKVNGVRVERLKGITADDLRKEGLASAAVHAGDMKIAQIEWAALWDSTIKKADIGKYGWDANPWVWVIEFERCEKPESEG